jgi:subtilisin family serine protease
MKVKIAEWLVGSVAVLVFQAMAHGRELRLTPDDKVAQVANSADVALIEVRALINHKEAIEKYKIKGAGCTVAILDTGINPTHRDFGKRIVAQLNLTSDNGGKRDNARDGEGHGTHVSGIVVANGTNFGIAPEAGIIAIKVLDNEGGGNFDAVLEALEWVHANRQKYDICAANMSLGDESNEQSITEAEGGELAKVVAKLRADRIPVVVAAGNDYFRYKTSGMSFPAIIPGTISVGAVYDARLGDKPITYRSGAIANTTIADQITPFSQRLPDDVGKEFRTDVFGPGASVTSTGANDDTGQSISSGTSQASPVVAGVVLLAQSYWKSKRGELPTVDNLEKWLRSGKAVKDGDDEDDNVPHTQASFIRIDALATLDAVHCELPK